MFFNKSILKSIQFDLNQLSNNFWTKINQSINFYNIFIRNIIFTNTLVFFCWKSSNYASSNWFLYDCRLQQTSNIIIK